MIDEPQSDSGHNQSDQDLEKVMPLPPETTNTSKAPEKQGQAKQYRNYSKYIVRTLKACGRGLVNVINWLDAKGGFVTAIATVVIAILTGVYVHYSRAQWRVMRDQLPELHTSAEAAKRAADTAGRELELSERPWVSADLTLVGPLVFDKDGAHVTARLSLKNSGHSPAVRGFYNIDFFAPFLMHPDPRKRRDDLCKNTTGESALPSNAWLSKTWFPGDQPPVDIKIGMSERDIHAAMVEIPDALFPNARERYGINPPRPPYIFPVVITCIAYRPSFADVQYHTSLVLDLLRRDPKKAIDPNKGDIPVSDLGLFQDFAFGGEAN
jgi:hypothetical protein